MDKADIWDIIERCVRVSYMDESVKAEVLDFISETRNNQ